MLLSGAGPRLLWPDSGVPRPIGWGYISSLPLKTISFSLNLRLIFTSPSLSATSTSPSFVCGGCVLSAREYHEKIHRAALRFAGLVSGTTLSAWISGLPLTLSVQPALASAAFPCRTNAGRRNTPTVPVLLARQGLDRLRSGLRLFAEISARDHLLQRQRAEPAQRDLRGGRLSSRPIFPSFVAPRPPVLGTPPFLRSVSSGTSGPFWPLPPPPAAPAWAVNGDKDRPSPGESRVLGYLFLVPLSEFLGLPGLTALNGANPHTGQRNRQ